MFTTAGSGGGSHAAEPIIGTDSPKSASSPSLSTRTSHLSHQAATATVSSATSAYPHISSHYAGQYASAAGMAADPYHPYHGMSAAAAAHYPASMDVASWYAATNNSLGHLYRGYDMPDWHSAPGHHHPHSSDGGGGGGVDPLAAASGLDSYNAMCSSRLQDPHLVQPNLGHQTHSHHHGHHQSQQSQHLGAGGGGPESPTPKEYKTGINLFGNHGAPSGARGSSGLGIESHPNPMTSQSQQQQQPQHSSPDSGLATSDSGSPNDPVAPAPGILPPGLGIPGSGPPGGSDSPDEDDDHDQDHGGNPGSAASLNEIILASRSPGSYSWMDKRPPGSNGFGGSGSGGGSGGGGGRTSSKEGGCLASESMIFPIPLI